MDNQETNINESSAEKDPANTEAAETQNDVVDNGTVNGPEKADSETPNPDNSESTVSDKSELKDDISDETKEFPVSSEEIKPVEEASDETKEFSAVAEKKADKKKKSSKTSPVRVVILVVCIAVFAFSGYKIVSEIIDGANTEKMTEDLRDSVRDDNGDDENHDEINVPPAPIDPSVSGSSNSEKSNTGTETVENNTDPDPETNSGSTNTETTPDPEQDPEEDPEPANETQPSETSGNSGTTVPSNPVDNENYNDRTYEEEQLEQQQITEEEDTQYYISRPSKDKDTYEAGVVIRPEEIKLSTIPYLRVSNLKKLLNTNSDTVGWIYIAGSKEEAKGTPIDTAIVQTTDNEYYLDHTFDKKENINGWVYADYRCNMDSITSNYNTVIYGHARSYKMFGGLKELNEAVEWYSNGNNHFIKINTFNDETVWQIFSWYETDIYFDYIKTNFQDSNEFIRFAYEVQSKNQMEGVFETFEFTENDRILTLSTCKGLDRAVRIAVHAKLVKRNPLN